MQNCIVDNLKSATVINFVAVIKESYFCGAPNSSFQKLDDTSSHVSDERREECPKKKQTGKGGILGAPGSKEKHEVDFGSRLAGKSFRG